MDKVRKDSVEVLFKCMVCGDAFGSRQALRGHMNAHRGEDIRTTHIVVKGEKWDKFKEFCRSHNTTTCHMIDALISLALKAKETGIVDITGPNPVIFNFSQVFLGKPRSGGKVELPQEVMRETLVGRGHCPDCGELVDNECLDPFEQRVRNSSARGCRKCGAQWVVTAGKPYRGVER